MLGKPLLVTEGAADHVVGVVVVHKVGSVILAVAEKQVLAECGSVKPGLQPG